MVNGQHRPALGLLLYFLLLRDRRDEGQVLLGSMQGYALIGLMVSIALMLMEPLKKAPSTLQR